IVRPSSLAFFQGRPALLFPALDGIFVPLAGTFQRLLAAPVVLLEDAPHLGGVVLDPEVASDDLGRSGLGPTSPWKPKDSAPGDSSSRSWSRCAADRRGLTPGGGWWRKLSTPPSLPRFSHWLTAPWVTPGHRRFLVASSLSGVIPRPAGGPPANW